MFEDQIEFIKATVVEGDKVYLIFPFLLNLKWSFNFLLQFSYPCFFFFDMQFDDELATESLDESNAKSALEKLQVCWSKIFNYRT